MGTCSTRGCTNERDDPRRRTCKACRVANAAASAQHLAERNALADAQGTCRYCLTRPRDDGRVSCAVCRRDRARKHAVYFGSVQAERKASGLCILCGEPHEGPNLTCDVCLEHAKALKLKRHPAVPRVCKTCDSPPRAPLAIYCEPCYEEAVARRQEKARRQYARKVRLAQSRGVCTRCGGKRDRADRRRCAKCRKLCLAYEINRHTREVA